MGLRIFYKKMGSSSFFMAVMVFMALFVLTVPGSAAKTKQKTFASPEEAVKALVDAVKSDSDKELAAIFGHGSQDLISSGDRVDDRAGRERFLKAIEARNRIELAGPGKAVLHIGSQDYPFSIPVIKKGDAWSFDTKAGREEILNRRIGRNELNVIGVLHGYADAQREYASKDRDADSVSEFAQKLISSKGKKDGLYWDVKEGEEESPFGPLIAKAAREGYAGGLKTDKPEPFHGYYFRILKSQGINAKGGAFNYVANGHMVLGFALVAYPARYGSSGIMTLIVNQEGIIYEKDLGKDTAGKAQNMKKYDPDKTWKKVEETIRQ